MNLTNEDPGLTCYTDGASRGNPGPSAYAYLVCDRDRILDETGKFLGKATNNEAEYQAVIAALDAGARFSHGSVTVFSDSELVIRQLNGRYAVRAAHLLPLYRRVKEREGMFQNVEYRSVPRENPLIRRMDALCNRILDDAVKR
ncbi:ribonuclease HI [Methanolinea mesophila]|uniref:ribonuclease HI family protein n=1 Tax=Methanolinea mesophila TaxID=547055 RepID=UPI001AE1B95C|nr:ribonuclease HI family protein [Methanolinea mesophila]MBP1927953.1 ribonuclease HI [Methanolinea mesophila]